MFHCYPRRDGQKWRRSVAHLKARWSIFTGRKVVAVATDETTDTAEAVESAFGDPSVRFLRRKNNSLQETASFADLLRAVETDDPDEITLYGHSKGCTHAGEDSASHFWMDAMAAACLDFPELVECAMTRAHTCGAFRSTMPIGWPKSPPWHFAGTYWWVRTAELFRRDWLTLDPFLWAVESYPGWKFTHAESACLFFDHAETAHLYDPEFWKRSILPAWRLWRRRLAECGLSPVCRTPPNHPLVAKAIA